MTAHSATFPHVDFIRRPRSDITPEIQPPKAEPKVVVSSAPVAPQEEQKGILDALSEWGIKQQAKAAETKKQRLKERSELTKKYAKGFALIAWALFFIALIYNIAQSGK